MAVPDAVMYKVVRAHEHLKELEAECNRYYETNPAKMVRQEEGNPNEFIGRIETRGPIPARFPVIIGDCLQNLRSSLDYLVWELVLAAKNNPSEKNMFPICTTEEAFLNQLSRHRLDGVPVDAVAIIKALQPYRAGNDAKKTILFVIDDFCNINKHRRILLTHLHAGQAPESMRTKTIDGELWIEFDPCAMKDDAKFGPFPIVDGPQGPGLEMEMNVHLLAFIAFNEGPTRNMHITVLLGRLIEHIAKEVLPKFDQFF